MKKSELQKPIKPILEQYGFQRVKGDFYTLTTGDDSTKLCLRIPDGKKGFILGVQFSDFGLFDGIQSHCAMQQFDHAYDLAYGTLKDYSVDEIISVTEQVCRDYNPYFIFGADEIKNRIHTWTFGDLDERTRNTLLHYLKQDEIDPYSEQYFLESVEKHTHNGGMMVLPASEYNDHKDFYDRYIEFGAKIEIKHNTEQICIFFSEARKRWQE